MLISKSIFGSDKLEERLVPFLRRNELTVLETIRWPLIIER